MAATPRHPLLRRAVDEVVKNVEARYYGRSELDITGPFLMGKLASAEAAKPAGEGLPFRLELEEVSWARGRGRGRGRGRVSVRVRARVRIRVRVSVSVRVRVEAAGEGLPFRLTLKG